MTPRPIGSTRPLDSEEGDIVHGRGGPNEAFQLLADALQHLLGRPRRMIQKIPQPLAGEEFICSVARLGDPVGDTQEQIAGGPIAAPRC